MIEKIAKRVLDKIAFNIQGMVPIDANVIPESAMLINRRLQKYAAHRGAIRNFFAKFNMNDIPELNIFHSASPKNAINISRNNDTVLSAAEAMSKGAPDVEATPGFINAMLTGRLGRTQVPQSTQRELAGLILDGQTAYLDWVQELTKAVRPKHMSEGIFFSSTPIQQYGPATFVHRKTFRDEFPAVTVPRLEGGARKVNEYVYLPKSEVSPGIAVLPRVKTWGKYYDPMAVVMGRDGKATQEGIAVARQLKEQGFLPLNRQMRKGLLAGGHDLNAPTDYDTMYQEADRVRTRLALSAAALVTGLGIYGYRNRAHIMPGLRNLGNRIKNRFSGLFGRSAQ